MTPLRQQLLDMITQPNTDQRTYYPIAAAIGGLMIAFGWVSNKRKSWPQKGDKSGAASERKP